MQEDLKNVYKFQLVGMGRQPKRYALHPKTSCPAPLDSEQLCKFQLGALLHRTTEYVILSEARSAKSKNLRTHDATMQIFGAKILRLGCASLRMTYVYPTERQTSIYKAKPGEADASPGRFP